MEANRKRVQVHMLPTEESPICEANGKLYYYPRKNWFTSSAGTNPKHLYFTDDSEIKEGDWYYLDEQISKASKSGMDDWVENQLGGAYRKCRKIIASTDPKLTVKYDNGVRDFGWETKSISYKKLPQPTQALIKAYCEQGGFDWVDVEYEVKGTIGKKLGDNALYHGLKVDPIHNTITTYRIVEKMYSRENLENLMMQSYIYGQSDKTDSFHKRESTIEKLIKENL